MKKAKGMLTAIFLLIFNIFGLVAFLFLMVRKAGSKRKKKKR